MQRIIEVNCDEIEALWYRPYPLMVVQPEHADFQPIAITSSSKIEATLEDHRLIDMDCWLATRKGRDWEIAFNPEQFLQPPTFRVWCTLNDLLSLRGHRVYWNKDRQAYAPAPGALGLYYPRLELLLVTRDSKKHILIGQANGPYGQGVLIFDGTKSEWPGQLWVLAHGNTFN